MPKTQTYRGQPHIFCSIEFIISFCVPITTGTCQSGRSQFPLAMEHILNRKPTLFVSRNLDRVVRAPEFPFTLCSFRKGVRAGRQRSRKARKGPASFFMQGKGLLSTVVKRGKVLYEENTAKSGRNWNCETTDTIISIIMSCFAVSIYRTKWKAVQIVFHGNPPSRNPPITGNPPT